MPRALLITGVSGVGKSTVANAIGGVLSTAGLVTAVVDTDALAQFGPPPPVSGFHDQLKCRNLAAVWANYRAAGAQFIVVSAGIESASLRDRYVESLAGCEVQTVRLVATTETVRQRLRDRDGEERPLSQLAATFVEDFTVPNDRPVIEVAREIIARAGWLS